MIKLAYPLMFLATLGLVFPAFAQNVSLDETDIKIREEIASCEKDIQENDSLSEAEKTVAKRDCTTEIQNKYRNENLDHQLASGLKVKLENIQRCEDWFPQYQFLDEEQFRIQKNSDIVTDCIRLYKDSVWSYRGDDRPIVLIERLNEIRSLPTITDREPTLLTLSPVQSQILTEEQKTDRIYELESRVQELEEQLDKKDAVLQEQMKVIMDLANRIRNISYDMISFFQLL